VAKYVAQGCESARLDEPAILAETKAKVRSACCRCEVFALATMSEVRLWEQVETRTEEAARLCRGGRIIGATLLLDGSSQFTSARPDAAGELRRDGERSSHPEDQGPWRIKPPSVLGIR
jgi:hypothetical protein